jgi:hypothetical protein
MISVEEVILILILLVMLEQESHVVLLDYPPNSRISLQNSEMKEREREKVMHQIDLDLDFLYFEKCFMCI